MVEQIALSNAESDATFVGWQETLQGELSPLYTITDASHPSYRSTVSDVTLRRLGLRVPRTPSPYPEVAPAPWHSLGIELSQPKTAREAVAAAGLDYTVAKSKLEPKKGLASDAYALERTDTGDILGIVGKRYEPIQNRDAFGFFDELVNQQEAVYETAGVIGKGERIWILAKLPGHINVNGNDIVNKYLLLTNSHDGNSQVSVKLTPVRLVCNNTLTSALQGAGEAQILHAPDAMHDLDQAISLLGMSVSLFEQLDVIFNRMAAKKITEEQLRAYVEALVPDNQEWEHSARTEKIRTSVLHLHDSGRGAHLSRGTVWGAFNSVTEYTDHLMLTDDPTGRLNSIWFGRGEQLKLKAFHLAEHLMAA